MSTWSQSGALKSTVGVNDCFGVDASAVSTSIEKSTCILSLLPQPPSARSAAMIVSLVFAFARPDTSVLKNIGVSKYGPTSRVGEPSTIGMLLPPSGPSLRGGPSEPPPHATSTHAI